MWNCEYMLSLLVEQDIQQLLQLQQLVLVPGHPLPSPAQFLLPQAQQAQQGGEAGYMNIFYVLGRN